MSNAVHAAARVTRTGRRGGVVTTRPTAAAGAAGRREVCPVRSDARQGVGMMVVIFTKVTVAT